jgi:hypothetical protein
MEAEKPRSAEALALERIADAAREVQAASKALEKHFGNDGSHRPSMLELARLAAAMQELKDAREAFDSLMVSGTDSSPGQPC